MLATLSSRAAALVLFHGRCTLLRAVATACAELPLALCRVQGAHETRMDDVWPYWQLTSSPLLPPSSPLLPPSSAPPPPLALSPLQQRGASPTFLDTATLPPGRCLDESEAREAHDFLEAALQQQTLGSRYSPRSAASFDLAVLPITRDQPCTAIDGHLLPQLAFDDTEYLVADAAAYPISYAEQPSPVSSADLESVQSRPTHLGKRGLPSDRPAGRRRPTFHAATHAIGGTTPSASDDSAVHQAAPFTPLYHVTAHMPTAGLQRQLFGVVRAVYGTEARNAVVLNAIRTTARAGFAPIKLGTTSKWYSDAQTAIDTFIKTWACIPTGPRVWSVGAHTLRSSLNGVSKPNDVDDIRSNDPDDVVIDKLVRLCMRNFRVMIKREHGTLRIPYVEYAMIADRVFPPRRLDHRLRQAQLEFARSVALFNRLFDTDLLRLPLPMAVDTTQDPLMLFMDNLTTAVRLAPCTSSKTVTTAHERPYVDFEHAVPGHQSKQPLVARLATPAFVYQYVHTTVRTIDTASQLPTTLFFRDKFERIYKPDTAASIIVDLKKAFNKIDVPANRGPNTDYIAYMLHTVLEALVTGLTDDVCACVQLVGLALVDAALEATIHDASVSVCAAADLAYAGGVIALCACRASA